MSNYPGYDGEGKIDHRVQVVKTHAPNRPGPAFVARKAVVLVRNPFDALYSWWKFRASGSHAEKGGADKQVDVTRYAEAWAMFAEYEFEIWLRFHRYWLQDVGAHTPMLVLPYEALLGEHRDAMLQVLLRFLRSDGDAVVAADVQAAMHAQAVYTPRSLGRVPGYTKEYFPAALRDRIQKESRGVLCSLGYEVWATLQLDCGSERAPLGQGVFLWQDSMQLAPTEQRPVHVNKDRQVLSRPKVTQLVKERELYMQYAELRSCGITEVSAINVGHVLKTITACRSGSSNSWGLHQFMPQRKAHAQRHGA